MIRHRTNVTRQFSSLNRPIIPFAACLAISIGLERHDAVAVPAMS